MGVNVMVIKKQKSIRLQQCELVMYMVLSEKFSIARIVKSTGMTSKDIMGIRLADLELTSSQIGEVIGSAGDFGGVDELPALVLKHGKDAMINRVYDIDAFKELYKVYV